MSHARTVRRAAAAALLATAAANGTAHASTPGHEPDARSARVHAATAHRPAHHITIPRSTLKLAAKYRERAGKPARHGAQRRAAHYRIPPRDVKRLLRASWKAFGYRGHALETRVAANYRQVCRESQRRPAVLQGYIGDVNDRRPAGGLMQFVTPTFKHWKVGRRGDRFNPLDNILAAVNAQVHGDTRILNGHSGWSPPLRHNPLHGRHALRIAGPSGGKHGTR
jgi:hypothetical protein